VVQIDVRVPQRVHEVAWLKPAFLRHQHEQEGVTCDIERHAERDVGRALVELHV